MYDKYHLASWNHTFDLARKLFNIFVTKKTLCRFNTTRQINTARYQTPGCFKCAHIYQPGCVACTLFANTTLYTLSYIVHRLTSGCMKVFPSVTVRKMVTGGKRNPLFRADTRLWQERQAEIHWISEISRILLKRRWQYPQNNSVRWFETCKSIYLCLWNSKSLVCCKMKMYGW